MAACYDNDVIDATASHAYHLDYTWCSVVCFPVSVLMCIDVCNAFTIKNVFVTGVGVGAV